MDFFVFGALAAFGTDVFAGLAVEADFTTTFFGFNADAEDEVDDDEADADFFPAEDAEVFAGFAEDDDFFTTFLEPLAVFVTSLRGILCKYNVENVENVELNVIQRTLFFSRFTDAFAVRK